MATAQQIIDGLQILMKYGDVTLATGKEQLFAMQADEASLSTEDIQALRDLSWFLAEDFCTCAAQGEDYAEHEPSCAAWSIWV